ncbi:DUF418 domain-containing protein [Sporosarcina limicola]|uniref:Membrane protein YeiB n=1 Tax=Sporosarcina limicola TaxID=34101 RepID=A0A927R4X0_9BACL|nr:heparan-alpha-glucosaminide N-acetyltransferase domain-containing protein [Sporosarcina limicola]MBE1556681.1 putative membrane protein YeiB [Sporosarcina limicola]
MTTRSKRIEGLDFARAWAMLGMLIVNYKILTGAEGNGPTWLIHFMDLFEGRASALFVILAGIGISLMTRTAREANSFILLKETRKTIWKRALFLFIVGMILYVIGWTGDILHYYGLYLFIGSLLIAAKGKMLLWLSAAALLIAQTLQLTNNTLEGWDPGKPYMEYLDFWTFEGFFRNSMFNGYHPVLPWICFFLLGMWIGKLNLNDGKIRKKILVISAMVAILLECLSALMLRIYTPSIGLESAYFLFGTGPILPNIFYVLSASGTALVILVLCLYFTNKYADYLFTDMIIKTGQLTLTHYVSHVIIGIELLDVLNRMDNQTLAFSLGFSIAYFTISILFSVLWRRKYSRGPIEILMRKIGH